MTVKVDGDKVIVDIEAQGLKPIEYIDVDGVIFMDAGEEHMWWTTLKGENIRINKMDTDHLKNTIAMLKRNGRYKSKRLAPVYRNMQEEYFKRISPAGGVLFGKTKEK